MTTEEFWSLPDDGKERDLIRGELRERPMTKRNRWHSRVLARVTYFLEAWLIQQSEPRGQILVGEAGVRLRRDPDSTVGVDAAYFTADVLRETPSELPWVDGPPVLAVEVLSPSDT